MTISADLYNLGWICSRRVKVCQFTKGIFVSWFTWTRAYSVPNHWPLQFALENKLIITHPLLWPRGLSDTYIIMSRPSYNQPTSSCPQLRFMVLSLLLTGLLPCQKPSIFIGSTTQQHRYTSSSKMGLQMPRM